MRTIGASRLYLVSGAKLAAGRLADLVPSLAAAGVDVIQLREKDMEVGELVRAGEPIAEACRSAGIPFIVNDRPDIAVVLRAEGVHVGQDDLSPDAARKIIDPGIVGLSTHTTDQVNAVAAGDAGVDYAAVGPVFETPTKPGRAATGTALLRHAEARLRLPWFAIGGIDRSNLEEVMGAGARRIVVVRAITEAADPPAAAAELRALLDQVPLDAAGRA